MSACPFCEKSVPSGSRYCPHCGAAINSDEGASRGEQESSKERELRSLLQQGRKIEAIKLYREQTGAGLADAKNAIEAMQADTNLRMPLPKVAPSGEALDLEAELLRLLQEGQKIEAIKHYREWTGAGLKDAKDAVEALAARHGIVAKSAGCLSMLALCLILAVMLVLAG